MRLHVHNIPNLNCTSIGIVATCEDVFYGCRWYDLVDSQMDIDNSDQVLGNVRKALKPRPPASGHYSPKSQIKNSEVRSHKKSKERL